MFTREKRMQEKDLAKYVELASRFSSKMIERYGVRFLADRCRRLFFVTLSSWLLMYGQRNLDCEKIVKFMEALRNAPELKFLRDCVDYNKESLDWEIKRIKRICERRGVEEAVAEIEALATIPYLSPSEKEMYKLIFIDLFSYLLMGGNKRVPEVENVLNEFLAGGGRQ